MSDQDIKKISRVFDEKFKLLLGELTRVKREVSETKTGQFRQYSELSTIGKDIARIDSTLETISEEFGKQTKKMGILWEQVEEVTKDLEKVKETLDLHTGALKSIEAKMDNTSDQIVRLDNRLSTVEGKVGVVPQPELAI